MSWDGVYVFIFSFVRFVIHVIHASFGGRGKLITVWQRCAYGSDATTSSAAVMSSIDVWRQGKKWFITWRMLWCYCHCCDFDSRPWNRFCFLCDFPNWKTCFVTRSWSSRITYFFLQFCCCCCVSISHKRAVNHQRTTAAHVRGK